MAEVGPKLVVLPNPLSLTWRMWADTVVGYNPGLREMEDPGLEWVEFANRLCEALPDAPRPEGHETWESWASALKLAFHL